MGWNGIAVALIAKNNPLGVLPAALLFAYLDAGAKAAMLNGDVTFEIASIAQSFIFYFVTAQALYGMAHEAQKGSMKEQPVLRPAGPQRGRDHDALSCWRPSAVCSPSCRECSTSPLKG